MVARIKWGRMMGVSLRKPKTIMLRGAGCGERGAGHEDRSASDGGEKLVLGP